MSFRKTILCDFDSVLHNYSPDWLGNAAIPGLPVPGTIEWLCEMVEHFNVAIYSSRSCSKRGLPAMIVYLKKHGALVEKLDFPTQKLPAHLTIDDRAFCFKGTFPTTEWIKAFKPWNKR